MEKKIHYNKTRLNFNIEESNEGYILSSTCGTNKVRINEGGPSYNNAVKFISEGKVMSFQATPVGEVTPETVVALSQCFYVYKFENEIGALEAIHYNSDSIAFKHKYDRDAKYDQPILVHLDKLNLTGVNHGP